MCDGHSDVLVEIPAASPRGHLGRMRGIDACIADLVRVLNGDGFTTVASCCGHGTNYGSIALEDGRWLVLIPDADFRAMDTRLAVQGGEDEKEESGE